MKNNIIFHAEGLWVSVGRSGAWWGGGGGITVFSLLVISIGIFILIQQDLGLFNVESEVQESENGWKTLLSTKETQK